LRPKTWVLAWLTAVTVMGFLSTGMSVGAEQPSKPSRMERTADGVVGASISHPGAWVPQREAYTFDETYGFTLWHQGVLRPTTAGRPRYA
jgi:hypothetical protein